MRAKTIYAVVKEEGHVAKGCRYALLVKTSWGKRIFSCEEPSTKNWHPTAKAAREAAEKLPGGMNYFPEVGSQACPIVNVTKWVDDGSPYTTTKGSRRLSSPRLSKADACRFIQSALLLGWSRTVDTMRSGESQPPFAVNVILRKDAGWSWSQVIVGFHHTLRGTWIPSVNLVGDWSIAAGRKTIVRRGIDNARFELSRMESLSCPAPRKKIEVSFDI